MSNPRFDLRSTRRSVLGSAITSVLGLGTFGVEGVRADSDTDQTATDETADVRTMGAEARSQRVTLFGTMTEFAGHDHVWAGFTYKKKGTTSGSYGEEVKLWNPAASPARLPGDQQQGQTFSLTFEYGNEGVSEESEQWWLEPGNTYTYQAQARVPGTIGAVPIDGERREFTIPCSDCCEK